MPVFRSQPKPLVHVNAALFSAFVLLGCAYILAAKATGLPAFAVTAVPVLVMVLYAICVKFIGAFRLRDDQAGDNLYYLGFLYTLTSLGASLYQFRPDAPAEEIVQNFGVAVGSTIAGVALRVLFNQMRRDPEDVEQAARIELAEASRRVRRELDATVLELSHFRRSAQQQVSEGFEHVREEMEQVSNRILESFESMTSRAAKPFESASENSSAVLTELAKTIGESLDSAAKRLAEENAKLAAETNEIASALRSTAERLSAMQTPDKVVEIRLEPVVSALSETIGEFVRHVKEKESAVDSVAEAAKRMERDHRGQTEAVLKVASALGSVANSLHETEERFVHRADRLLALAEEAEASRAHHFDSLREVVGEMSSLASSISASQEAASAHLDRLSAINGEAAEERRREEELFNAIVDQPAPVEEDYAEDNKDLQEPLPGLR